MRLVVAALWATAAAWSLESPIVAVAEPARRPNVLFILTDDQRWDALGVAGNPHLKTPHIDRLAREGVYFPNAFCTTSLCSPSRATILSGLYAHSHKVTNNFTEYPLDLPSFPRQLQKSGYHTAYIGKYHMGEENDDQRPGFDHFVTHRGQGKYFDTEFRVNGGDRQVRAGYYTHVVTQMALDWLKQPREKPFLLMLGHKAPHSFYTPEPRYAAAFNDVKVEYPASAFQLDDKPTWFRTRLSTWHGIYGPLFDFRKKFPDSSPAAVKDFEAMTRAYWATLLSVDDSVGKLYTHLKQTGELDRTLIIFTGDNGLLNGEHGMVDKRTMHEASIRVPLIARYPGLTATDKPRVVEQMVLHTDLAPTILDLCGAPALPKTHGASWKKLAQGEAVPWRKAWCYSYNYEKQFPYTPNVRGVRTDRFKYIRYPQGGKPFAPDTDRDQHLEELYDLKADPLETKNLINSPAHQSELPALRRALKETLTAVDAFPDHMPADEGIKAELPDLKIR